MPTKTATKPKASPTRKKDPVQRSPATTGGDLRDPRVDYDGPILGSFGVTGLKRSGSALLEEFHPKLKGKQADKVYREMEDNDPLIGGALWGMETLVRQVDFHEEPKKDAGTEGQALAEWFQGMRNDMESTWEEHLSNIMSCVTFGWAWFEELYKLRRGPEETDPRLQSQFSDGLFGLRDLGFRSQDSRERFAFDREGHCLGMWQQVSGVEGGRYYVPLEKSLLFRVRERKNNPEGRSLLRNCYKPYYKISNLEDLEVIGVQNVLQGVPIFKLPLRCMMKNATGLDRSLRTLAEEAVKAYRVDKAFGLVVPTDEDAGGKTGIELTFQSSGGDPSKAGPIVDRHRSNLLIALLWQMLLYAQQGGTGSYSLASEMTDLLAMAINAILRSICAVYNRTVIRRIGRLNNFDPRTLPELTFKDIEKPDTLKLWQAMQAFATSGGVMDDELENFGREQSGWPTRKPMAQTKRPVDPTLRRPTSPAPATKRAPQRTSRLLQGSRTMLLPGL